MYVREQAHCKCFSSVQLLLCFPADCYSFYCCVTKYPKLRGIGNSHFLMIREAVGWKFRETGEALHPDV